ncbi:MAG: hypothetical protein ACTHXC_00540 [Brachybacterium sp.]
MSEHRKQQRGAATVLGDLDDARGSGDLPEDHYIAYRLMTMAYAVKPGHMEGAAFVAREYCSAVGIDPDYVETQAGARIAEAMKFEDIAMEARDD